MKGGIKKLETETLELKIGNEEQNTTLQPKPVRVLSIRKEEVGVKKNEKLIFECKHPDREETIEISTVKHLVGNTLKTQGSWVSLDTQGNLYKNSAVAKLMLANNALRLNDLVSKELLTELDDNGYLCFKVY